MRYLDLDIIKKQLRMDSSFTDDDAILEVYGDSAESFLESYLDTNLDVIAAQNSGELPKELINAMLMFVDYMYDNSGSGETRDIPKAFFMLACLYKKYPVA